MLIKLAILFTRPFFGHFTVCILLKQCVFHFVFLGVHDDHFKTITLKVAVVNKIKIRKVREGKDNDEHNYINRR